MIPSEKDLMAEKVMQAWNAFQNALSSNKRSYPKDKFYVLFRALKDYVDLMRDDTMIHKSVARAINSFGEYLRMERKNVPGEILYDTNRMECMLFSGYDPYYRGLEPPDL